MPRFPEIGIALPDDQHLAHLGEDAALRIVLVTVPCVIRSCEYFPDGFDVRPQHCQGIHSSTYIALRANLGSHSMDYQGLIFHCFPNATPPSLSREFIEYKTSMITDEDLLRGLFFY